jgi:carboxyl-terminal processing protease
VRAHHSVWHRGHAYDSERTDAGEKNTYPSVAGQSYISGDVRHPDYIDHARPSIVIATEPNHRALVVGKTTYGKGSVQTVMLVTADTALSITTAYYYTPAGRSIRNKGIRPDIGIDQYADGEPDDALLTREIDCENHLANTQDPDEQMEQEQHDRESLARLRALEDRNGHKTPEQRLKDRDRKPVEFGSSGDFMLQQALNRLEGKPVHASKSGIASPPNAAQPPASDRSSD